MVLDEKADYKEGSDNIKRAIERGRDQVLERNVTREDSDVD